MALSRGERFEEARRKANKSMDVVAGETGLSKSMIQALEDDGNNRDVGYSNIVKLAICYNVSSDFLLGLSDIPSLDIAIRKIGEKTGLSEPNIQRLQFFNNKGQKSGKSSGFATLTNHKAMEILNFFLAHQKVSEFILNISTAMACSRLQVSEDATVKDLLEAERGAARIGSIVLPQKEAVNYYRQEAIRMLESIVYELVPEQKGEEE